MTRTRTLVLCLIAAMLLAAVSATTASAATCNDTWTNPSGGEWDVAGNWSSGVPGSGSEVCIEKAVSVTTTDGEPSPEPVKSLDVGGEGAAAALRFSIHNVLESGSTTIGPHASLTLDGTYHGANAGNATLRGGTVDNQGTIVMEGSGYGATLAGTVVNEGTIDVPFGTVEFGEGGNGEAGASLVNRGTIDVAAPSAEHPHEPATFDGVNAAIADEGGTIDNEGTFNFGGATYTQGNGTETGNPIRIFRNAALAYTGSGASSIEVIDGLPMSGNIAAGQKLQIDIGTIVTEASSFTNAGTILLNGNYYGGGGGPAGVAVSSGTLTNSGTIVAESNDNDPTLGGNVANSGTVTITPGTALEQTSGTFSNSGTLAPEISSSARSWLQLEEGAAFHAGGTLAPTLTGGFVPAVGQEYEVVIDRGGSWSGTFGAVADGFGGDYSHSGYIGAVYGLSATPGGGSTPPPAPAAHGALHVLAIQGGHGRVQVRLSCAAGGPACAAATITVTVIEHLKGRAIHAITARTRTRRVTIAVGAVSLAAGASVTKTLTLSRTGLALLAGHGPLAAAVDVSYLGSTLKSAEVHIAKVKKKHH